MPETRSGLGAILSGVVAAQRGHMVPWVPVSLAVGIGIWFGLPQEPEPWHVGAVVLAGVLMALLAHRTGEALRPFIICLSLICLGVFVAAVRTHSVAAPVLEFRYYGPIEGRIVAIDRSSSDAVRLTLDRVRLDDVAPQRTPARVRVSLHGTQGFIEPAPGLTVILTGHLSPPGGPVEPGGFDFQRHAWFKGLGAVGYTRTPVLALDHSTSGQMVFRVRRALFETVTARIEGSSGAFVAAILTGDRSGLPLEDLEALRASNLAHLLAISGLHMGLLTGVVFGAIRLGLALVPWIALRWPIKSIAALGALAAGAVYLALSGGNVATVRAFLMVSVMLGAVLAGRRAISLRAVALAAILILLLTPEALSSAGFQMSFAATVALVAVFSAVRDHGLARAVPKWAMPVLAVVLSSAVAGLATAPVSAAHFNRIADYGLLANLLSVPVMGTVVMPAAVVAAVLAPLGLAWIGFAVMDWGTRWILFVAHWVANLDGAQTLVSAPGPHVLPLLAIGALCWICARGRVRHLGVVPMVAAAALWASTPRPEILIAESGGLVGVMTEAGRALTKAKGDGFVARVWLENDGDGAVQDIAHSRVPPKMLDAVGVVHATGRAVAALPARCGPEEIWVVSKALPVPPQGGCTIFDPAKLRETGAVAVALTDKGHTIITARQRSGRRLWNDAASRRTWRVHRDSWILPVWAK